MITEQKRMLDEYGNPEKYVFDGVEKEYGSMAELYQDACSYRKKDAEKIASLMAKIAELEKAMEKSEMTEEEKTDSQDRFKQALKTKLALIHRATDSIEKPLDELIDLDNIEIKKLILKEKGHTHLDGKPEAFLDGMLEVVSSQKSNKTTTMKQKLNNVARQESDDFRNDGFLGQAEQFEEIANAWKNL
jgi:thioredoxin-like negative regulator of GroEL